RSPRVRGHAVDRDRDLDDHLAHHHADDVRLYPEAAARALGRRGRGGAAAGAAGAHRRAHVRRGAELLRAHAARRARPSAAHHDRVHEHDHPEHLPVRGDSQGLLPAAGYRPHHRRYPRRPEHLLPVDAAEVPPVRQHHPRGPGGRQRGRLHRRLPDQLGLPVRDAEAAQRGQGRRRQGDRAPQAQARAGTGRQRLPAGDPGHPGRRPPGQLAVSVHAAERFAARSLYLGAEAHRGAAQDTSVITDVDSDQQQHGLQVNLTIDRDAAARLNVSSRAISSTLYDAFGQRQVSTIYNALNQYHVVMEVSPEFWENPESLKDIYVSTSGGAISGAQATAGVVNTAPPSQTPRTASLTGVGATQLDPSQAVRNQRTNAIAVSGRGSASTGAAVSTAPETMIPLEAVTNYQFGTTPLGVNHQGLFVASTVSFNLAIGKTLSDAVAYVNGTMRDIGVPATIHGSFQGTARAFQQSLDSQILVVLAALAAIYIVLGVLY